MITEITKQESLTPALAYLGDAFKTVPYLYTDIKIFPKCNEQVRMWKDETDGVWNGVYLMYYDCMHFFTRDKETYPLSVLKQMIKELDPHVMMFQKEVGLRMEAYMEDDYFLERNCIFDMDSVPVKEGGQFKSVPATREDLVGFVDLLLTEERYAIVYDRDILLTQLRERFDNNTAKHIVIKEGGQIVAGYCTFGEVDDMALIGGMIVHKDWRRRGFAADVVDNMCAQLAAEGKVRMGFVDIENTPSIELHYKVGATLCGTYYKYIYTGGKETNL